MISTATNEMEACNWAQEMVYRSAKEVYKFLDAENLIALRYRGGGHATAARDIEDYIDFFDYVFGIGRMNPYQRLFYLAEEIVYETVKRVFELLNIEEKIAGENTGWKRIPAVRYIDDCMDIFDYVFGRGNFKPPQKLYHNYTFENWKKIADENIKIDEYPEKTIDDLLVSKDGGKISTVEEWNEKKSEIKKNIVWSFGKKPPRVKNTGQGEFNLIRGGRADYISDDIGRESARPTMGKITIAPYNSFGEYLRGDLYFPKEENEEKPKKKLPVIIWLHPYSYNSGYGSAGRQRIPAVRITEMGFAMFGFDQIGFGTRVAEKENFYKRYPKWSLMGKMVDDVVASVDALSNIDIIDPERIYCLGYSMGATVGLYAAALDERIKGVVSVCGFSPFRLDTPEKEKAGAIIKKYSHLHGLQPRLGFFLDAPKRIPLDFHEVLSLITPRPLFIVAPELDWDNVQSDVIYCVDEVRKIYSLMNAQDKLGLLANYDINRWTTYYNPETPQKEVFEWIEKMFK